MTKHVQTEGQGIVIDGEIITTFPREYFKAEQLIMGPVAKDGKALRSGEI
jgi:hypothetical protein